MKNTNSPFFKSNNLILRTKKPHPLHNEIANYADKNEHQERTKKAVSSHIKPYFLQNNLYAAIQPTGRNKKREQIKKRLFIVDYSPLFMNKALHFPTR